MLHQLLGIACLSCLFAGPASCPTSDLSLPIQSNGLTKSVPGIDRQEEAPSPLIDVDELNELLTDTSLVILDLGPEKEPYLEAHIPGAHYVDWVDDITDLNKSGRYNLIDQAGMQTLLRRLGVTEDSTIVVYDDMDSRVSVRMYWSLKYYGLNNIKVLNGGRPAWMKSDHPTTSENVEPKPSDFSITQVNKNLATTLEFIADRLQNPNVALIDGRPKAQFSGAEPGKVFHTGAIHNNKGHIPGAINILWKDNFKRDGTFKSRDELEKLYESVTGSDMIVTYCNEGLHAAPPWFVLSEMLGHGDVRLYDDSLSEWANSDQPLEKSDEADDK